MREEEEAAASTCDVAEEEEADVGAEEDIAVTEGDGAESTGCGVRRVPTGINSKDSNEVRKEKKKKTKRMQRLT